MKILLTAVLALTLAAFYTGCDRTTGEPDANDLPVVEFVNVPLDSSVFNYAPVVRWTGYDPDGMVQAYQYHDDSTQAAVDAYNAGNEALHAYIAGLPETVWTTTYSQADTIYLRRSETDSITQHVFMIRAVDNLGAVSPVKVRTFFRTNQKPYAPKIKWALDNTLDPIQDYTYVYNVPDTLLWGDTLTSTWGGVGFLWQGRDPDSRDLNIIPLTFSWLLVRETAEGVIDTFPHPILNDSNQVVGYGYGWSPWRSSTQMTLTAQHALDADPDFNLDGSYHFYVRVRDDGLTEADTMAVAHFTAVRPTYERQLLIVDWNRTPVSPDERFGLVPDAPIRQFYDDNVPNAFALAEQMRQAFYQQTMPEPIPFDTAWYLDKDLGQANRVPYDYIRKFKWVWVINDNPPRTAPPFDNMKARVKVLDDYMDVGGQVWLSGRRFLNGNFNISRGCGDPLVPSADNFAENFLVRKFHLSTVCPKFRYSASQGPEGADFGAAVTTDQFLPDLEIDTAKVHLAQYGTSRVDCLPEVDFFGRTSGTSGFDYAATLYNYSSCTNNQVWQATNVDCDTMQGTTASVAYLAPAPGHTRLIEATRAYNRTKGVYGEVIEVGRAPGNGGQPGPWRIVVSTPVEAGVWTNQDTLEVDYTYIPISTSHDQPIATNFIRIQGLVRYNELTGEYEFEGQTRFRSSVFVFPLYFMRNDYTLEVPYIGGQARPIEMVIAYQILFFNSPRSIFNSGGA